DTMRYVDQSWVFFVDATSPAKQRREKGQRKDEKNSQGVSGYDVLYRRMPRDMKVYGPILKEYRILAVIPLKECVFKTKMREFTETDTTDEGEIDTTSTILSGLKLKQFRYLYTKHIVGKDYYYAVQALNLTRRASPISDIVSGQTIDDSPEKLKEFYAVAYMDAERMQFEWTLPVFAEDQKQYNIYLYDENGDQHTIFTRPDAYPYTPQTNAIVPFDSIASNFETFNPANMKWYKFNIGEQDRKDQETLAKGEPIPAEIVENSEDVLPSVPEYFTVEDNPSDKGDQMRIYFDEPFLGISKIHYNDKFTELNVNYFIKDNYLFKVKKLTININGNEKTEYVLDDRVKFKVNWDPYKPMLITATFTCRNKGEKLPEDYSISHIFIYDKNMEFVRVDNLTERELNDLQINDPEMYKLYTEYKEFEKYNYQVYKINKFSDVYRFPKLLSYMEREYLDRIRYESVEFRGDPRFQLDDKRLYVNSYLSIENWKDEYPFYTMAIYLEQLEKNNEEIRDEITEFQKEIDETTDEEKIDSLNTLIIDYTDLIEDKPPIVKLANQQKTDKARMKILNDAHCTAKRTFKYFIRKTDG
ncbi:MAG: hypothetical protein KAW87_07465, partial [Candidatus Cloacimonetes bacterium]|nr:hypothetical protein [Candidatus Cloacimonadota bacterium]